MEQLKKIICLMEARLVLVLIFAGMAYAQSDYSFVLKWGSSGSGDGQFNLPNGIDVDVSGNVYVIDSQNDRLQKFSSDGTFLSKWGSLGTGDGQFDYPTGIAINSNNDVFITDNDNARIQKFSTDGTFITKWGSQGTGDGQFWYPLDVACDPSGYVYVCDNTNHRIQKFTSDGLYITKWGGFGSGDGQLIFPYGVDIDNQGYVYVADRNNNRIQKFTSDGTFVLKFGGQGTGDGQFSYPISITVDSEGFIYVGDESNRIQKFTSEGTFVTKWGTLGSGDGQFNLPMGIAVDHDENVFISDWNNNRIQKFTSTANVNQPPVANAGPDQTVIDNDNNGSETVTLDGSGSNDDDGNVVSYSWSEGETEIATGVNFEIDLTVGTHTITLTVEDDQGATGTDEVIITVEASSATIYVPEDYPTIQEAIDAANEFDTIRVSEGEYNDSLILKNGICIIGDGSEITEITYPNNPVITINGISEFILSGLHIKGPSSGSSITVINSSGIIENSKFTEASIWIAQSSLTINKNFFESCGISDNHGGNSKYTANLFLGGEGLSFYRNGTQEVVNNTIVYCSNYGIYLSGNNSSPVIRNNIIAFNGAYGIYEGNYNGVGPGELLRVESNDIYGNGTANYYDFESSTSYNTASEINNLPECSQNISVNPEFYCPDIVTVPQEFSLIQEAIDYINVSRTFKLTVGSPVLGAGLNGEDLGAFQGSKEGPSGQGIISIFAGTYNESIVMKPGILLQGAGKDVTSLSGPANPIIKIRRMAGIGIRGIAINTNGQSGSALVCEYGSGIINECKFSEAPMYIAISSLHVDSNIIEYCGISDRHGGSSKYTNNLIIGGDGFNFYRDGTQEVVNNTIVYCSNYGIYLSGNSSSPVIRNNIIAFNGAYGIYEGNYNGVGPGELLRVESNDMYGNGTANYYDFESSTSYNTASEINNLPECSHNISVNPEFYCPDIVTVPQEFSSIQEAINFINLSRSFELTAGSPALGAGLNGEDLGAFQGSKEGPSGQGIISISAGTYNESIVMKPGISLEGSGKDVTYLSGPINPIITIRRMAGVGIHGLAINTNATSGTAILSEKSVGTIKECSFSDISMYISESSLLISRNYFENCGISDRHGGGSKYINNIISGGNGFNFYRNGTQEIVNNTIVYCSNYGIYLSGNSSSPVIRNNIIAYNGDYGIYEGNYNGVGPGELLKVENNDIYGNNIANYYDFETATVYNSASEINSLPECSQNISMDVGLFDYANKDYHLIPESPCIDAGNTTYAPLVDFEGDIRPLDGNGDGVALVDIGAYEYVNVESGVITGRVTKFGEPLEGAMIYEGAYNTTYTNANGEYMFTEVQAGSRNIAAYSPEHVWINTQNITVIPGEIVEIDFDFTPGTVKGRVTKFGDPLEGAMIYEGAYNTTYTNANGEYTFTEVQAGSRNIAAYSPEHVWINTQNITVIPGEIVEIDFDFTPGTVKGRVTESGDPLEGAKMYEGPYNVTYTDPNGDYIFTEVQAGSRSIAAYSPDGQKIGTQSVSVTANETLIVNFPPDAIPEVLAVNALTNKSTYSPNEDVIIRAVVTDNNSHSIADATVTAVIVYPDANTSTLTLYNDGMHQDVEPHDGVYANTFSHSLEGSYTVTITAEKENMVSAAETATFALSNRDIAVIGGSYPAQQTRGTSVAIRVDVRNSSYIEEHTVLKVKDITDNRTLDSIAVLIPARSDKSINLNWETNEAPVGEHNLLVNLQIVPNEENVENNSHFFSITIQAPVGPVLSVAPPIIDLIMNKGQVKSIELSLANIGDQAIDNVFYETQGQYTEVKTADGKNLNPGEATNCAVLITVPYDEVEGSYSEEITINSENATPITVPVSITITNIENADIKVFVHNTFKMPVQGATVVLKDDMTTSAQTDENGIAILSTGAGIYTIYAAHSGYYSTIKEIELHPTPLGTESNEVDLLLIEDNVLAVEVTVTDISGTIVDYVEAGVTYHFKVTYYFGEVEPDPPTTISIGDWSVEPGWHTVPASGPVEPIVKTPGAVYIPSREGDILTTIEISGDVYQMKQVFDVKAKVYNKGGMTIEDVTAEMLVTPPEGLRLWSGYPSTVELGDITALSNKIANWLLIGDAAGDYSVTVNAKGYIFDLDNVCHEVSGSGSAGVTVNPLAILSFEFPELGHVTAGVPIDWTIALINTHPYPAYSVTVMLGELKNINLAPGDEVEKWVGDIQPDDTAYVTYTLIPALSGTIVGRTVEVDYPVFGVNIVAPDLAISPSGITFSDEVPRDGDIVTVTGAVQNLGNEEASNVLIRFYDGDPATAQQIGDDQIIVLIGPLETQQVSINWAATAGNHDIYVDVDPDNMINEFYESNNRVFKTIIVQSENHPPVADANGLYNGSPNFPITFDASASYDPDDDQLHFRWDFDNDGVWDTEWLSGPTVENTWDSEYSGIIVLQVSDGIESDIATTTVFIGAVNQPPVADAGDDQTTHTVVTVTLDGSGSYDEDGNYPLTYDWRFLFIPENSTATLVDKTSSCPSFIADLPGDYIIELTVTDVLGLPGTPDDVKVSTQNSTPIADAGTDQAIIQFTSVQLDGSSSWDDDGDELSYNWTIVQKPEGSAALLNDNTSPTPSFFADIYGGFVIELTVYDSWEWSEPDTVIVTFENVKPVADAGCNQSILAGDDVDLDGSGSYDANGDELAFTWDIISKPEESQAQLTTPNSVTTNLSTDFPGQYIISLVVNDGLLDSDPSTITILAVSKIDSITNTLQQGIDSTNVLPDSVFNNPNNKNTLTNKVNAVLKNVDDINYEGALNKLENDILKKTDGCATIGVPDKNDWIEDCESQQVVYPIIINAIDLLNGLIE